MMRQLFFPIAFLALLPFLLLAHLARKTALFWRVHVRGGHGFSGVLSSSGPYFDFGDSGVTITAPGGS